MNKIQIDITVAENIIKFCEDRQVYDKLSAYGDFYYKLKQAVREFDEPKDRITFPDQFRLSESRQTKEWLSFLDQEFKKAIYQKFTHVIKVNDQFNHRR